MKAGGGALKGQHQPVHDAQQLIRQSDAGGQPPRLAGKKVRRIQRPSVLQRLAQLRSQVKKPTVDREKRKEQTR